MKYFLVCFRRIYKERKKSF